LITILDAYAIYVVLCSAAEGRAGAGDRLDTAPAQSFRDGPRPSRTEGHFAGSKSLSAAVAIIVLAFAAIGAAQARGANFCRGGFSHAEPTTNLGVAYAGPTSLQHYYNVHHLKRGPHGRILSN
jgi:hypothetical protein